MCTGTRELRTPNSGLHYGWQYWGALFYLTSWTSEFSSHPSSQTTVKRKQNPKNPSFPCQLWSSPKWRGAIFPYLRLLYFLLPGAWFHMSLLLQAYFSGDLAAIAGHVINSFGLQVGGRGWLQLWWEGIMALKSLSGLPRCPQGEARLAWTLCSQHPSWHRSFQGTWEDEGNGNAKVTVLRTDASRLHLGIHLLLSPLWFQKQCWGVCYSDPEPQFSCHTAWV